MSFDLTKILDSKRAFRRDLAARPIGEKLRMLDAMREREISLRDARPSTGSLVQEAAAAYHVTRR